MCGGEGLFFLGGGGDTFPGSCTEQCQVGPVPDVLRCNSKTEKEQFPVKQTNIKLLYVRHVNNMFMDYINTTYKFLTTICFHKH